MFAAVLINDFLESLEVENGRSRFTSRNYELYLSRITEFSYEYYPDKELKPEDITQEWLRKYRLWLNRYEIANSKGKTLSVVVEGFSSIDFLYYGRAYFNAPDIDGKVYFSAEEELSIGDKCDVIIKRTTDYDLIGKKL